MIIQIIGYLAAFSLTITLMPQLVKTYKEKKVEDISKGFICLNLTTSVLFLVYGVLLEQIPIVLSYCILITQNLILLYYKISYSQAN